MLQLTNSNTINSRKHGFSLIETVIGMGLLLIVIIIVYQGFMSTIQLSANTANYEATGDLASGLVSNQIAAASITPLTSPDYKLHLASGTFTKDIGIFVYSATPVTNTNYGVAEYREVSYGSSSTNRTGFWYIGKPL